MKFDLKMITYTRSKLRPAGRPKPGALFHWIALDTGAFAGRPRLGEVGVEARAQASDISTSFLEPSGGTPRKKLAPR